MKRENLINRTALAFASVAAVFSFPVVFWLGIIAGVETFTVLALGVVATLVVWVGVGFGVSSALEVLAPAEETEEATQEESA